VLDEMFIARGRSAQWQMRGFCLGNEPSEGWGSSDDLVEATALRVAALDKLVYCPGVGSGCVLRCQPTERRAIELVGTDSIYSTGVAEGGRSVDAEPLAKDIQCRLAHEHC
jgi:hypothetical protein